MDAENVRLRQAALVVASLEQDAADQLLDLLPEETAQRVRNQLMGLAAFDWHEQQSAIRDFMVGENPVESATRGGAGRSVAGERRGHATRELRPVAGNGKATAEEAAADALDRASERMIADCLRQEVPQAIAIALAGLPTERASEVIACLPGALQTEVLERLVEYEPTMVAWSEIRDEFHQWLNEQLETQLHRADLAARLAAILEASHPGTRQRILRNFTNGDEQLAVELQQHLGMALAGSHPT